MIKALCLIAALFGAQHEAVRVTLPIEKVLRERIAKVTNGCFSEVKNTKLTQELADREKEAEDVIFDVSYHVEETLFEYKTEKLNYCVNPKQYCIVIRNVIPCCDEWFMRDNVIPLLVKSILADSPEAIKELQDKGYLDK